MLFRSALWGVLTVLPLLIVACGGGTGGGGQGGTDGGDGGANINRPIDFIVTFGSGGGADTTARTAAPVMEEELGVQIPVINTPGATGSVGMNEMLNSRPGSAMATLIQDTLATVAFDTASFSMDQLQPVCRLLEAPSGMYVQGDGPYSNWDELAAAAQENPGEVRVATVGEGGVDNVILGAFAEQGIEFQAVPYSDPGERYAALLGGEVDALYEQPGDVRSQLESGKFKTVVMFAEEEVEGLEGDYVLGKDVGMDLVLNQFRGIAMHADTDPAVVNAVSDACAKVPENQRFQEFLDQNYATEDSYMNSEEYTEFVNEQLTVLEDRMEQYNIK